MVENFSFDTLHHWPRLRTSMLADRKKVFIDTLRWPLPHDGQHEFDQFDDRGASYLIMADMFGRHKGSTRLLPSTGPHILGNIFPFLCEDAVPRDDAVMEITRFLMSPRFRAAERRKVRNALVRALVEYAHERGITGYTAVCDIGFLSQVLAAGWRCSPLGLPQQVDGSLIGAFMIHIEPDTIEQLVPAWSHPGRALQTPLECVA